MTDAISGRYFKRPATFSMPPAMMRLFRVGCAGNSDHGSAVSLRPKGVVRLLGIGFGLSL